jgi:phenylacetate-CoA ligase
MVNDHLERIAREGPSYLLGEYHAVATGGSTGRRGVVVWDFEGFRLVGSRGPAWGIATAAALDMPSPLPMTVASIGSVNPIHAGGAITRCFSSAKTTRMHSIAASRPIEEIAAELEALQPRAIVGYASVLHQLALRKQGGRLSVEPAGIVQGGEPFLPEAQEAVTRAFDTAVVRDIWGASEIGFGASSFPGFEGLVLSEDLMIVEPVDEAGAPVSLGERADKIFVTNLANRVLPIIRYELSDEVTMAPPHPECPWKGHRLLTIHGRQDDVFRYADRVVHPHTFRSVLTRFARVAEYQVRQTPSGAEVSVVRTVDEPIEPLRHALCAALERAGLSGPEVHVESVPAIARHPDSQKLKRFVPL